MYPRLHLSSFAARVTSRCVCNLSQIKLTGMLSGFRPTLLTTGISAPQTGQFIIRPRVVMVPLTISPYLRFGRGISSKKPAAPLCHHRTGGYNVRSAGAEPSGGSLAGGVSSLWFLPTPRFQKSLDIPGTGSKRGATGFWFFFLSLFWASLVIPTYHRSVTI